MSLPTVPERVLISTRVNVSSVERAVSLALGVFFGARAMSDRRDPVRASAFGFASFAFLRRAFTGRSRLYESLGVATAPREFLPLRSSALTAVSEPQRTMTVSASLAEVELFFADMPRLAGYELGRDCALALKLKPAPHAGTEVQARLTRWPSALNRRDVERALREILREAKQLIETGEVARIDGRVHGPRSRRERELT